jgi:hypothetical protein
MAKDKQTGMQKVGCQPHNPCPTTAIHSPIFVVAAIWRTQRITPGDFCASALTDWPPVFVQLWCVSQQQRPHLLTVQLEPTMPVALQQTKAAVAAAAAGGGKQ